MYKWLPVIDQNKCTGCKRCVDVCQWQCIKMIYEMAALEGPNHCGSEEHCVRACADHAIQMDWVQMDGNSSVGVWSPKNA